MSPMGERAVMRGYSIFNGVEANIYFLLCLRPPSFVQADASYSRPSYAPQYFIVEVDTPSATFPTLLVYLLVLHKVENELLVYKRSAFDNKVVTLSFRNDSVFDSGLEIYHHHNIVHKFILSQKD